MIQINRTNPTVSSLENKRYLSSQNFIKFSIQQHASDADLWKDNQLPAD